MTQFTLMEADKVFDHNRGPFAETIPQIRNAVVDRADELTIATSQGGTVPESGQWVLSEPRPTFFSGQGNDPGASQITAAGSDFRQSSPSSTGFTNALAADLTDSGELGQEWVLGIAGWVFNEPTRRYSELRPRSPTGDRTLPVTYVGDAFKTYDTPAMLYNFEEQQDVESFVFDENNDFAVEANFTSTSGFFELQPIAVAAVPQGVAITQAPS